MSDNSQTTTNDTMKGQDLPYTFKSDQTGDVDEKLVVLKIGSSSLSSDDGTVQLSTLSKFVETIYELTQKGYKVIIVSSGAVSIGCNRLQLSKRPTDPIAKHACAAVGQSRLMRLYDDLFSIFNIPVAQVLLTRDNIAQEDHYLNAANTIHHLLELGIVTIINENDTVSVFELKLGDNDTLSAMVASMMRAKWLILVTDVDSLYTANPHVDPSATPIRIVDDISSLLVDTTTTGDSPSSTDDSATASVAQSGNWGTGGMETKITAARMASYSGVTTGIVSSRNFDHIPRMLDNDTSIGTIFLPSKSVLTGRKKWITIGVVPSGTITVDKNTANTLKQCGSLFSSGIIAVEGDFPRNSCVSIVVGPDPSDDQIDTDSNNGTANMGSSTDMNNDDDDAVNTGDLDQLEEIGRGLVNFSSDEISMIMGQDTCDIEPILVKHYSESQPESLQQSFPLPRDYLSLDVDCAVSQENIAIYERSPE